MARLTMRERRRLRLAAYEEACNPTAEVVEIEPMPVPVVEPVIEPKPVKVKKDKVTKKTK